MSLQPKDLRYTISTDYGETQLVHAPKGWDEGLIKWIRSEKYWGMFRSFSIPMQFALDGKDVLTEVYAKQGSEGRAEVLIERLDRTTWAYVTYYIGVVDFSKIKWGHDFIECNLVDGGLSQMVKNKAETKYDINKAPYNTLFESRVIAVEKFNVLPVEFMQCDFISYRSAIESLLYEMAGYEVALYCPILDELLDESGYETLYITNGRALRNDAANMLNFNLTLSGLFQMLNMRFCCGMGVEVIDDVETLVIARREYFLQDTEICDTVPNTREVEISPAIQFVGNVLKYGYANWEPEYPDVANKWMFNKPAEVSIPVKTVSNTIEAQSEYYTEGRYIQWQAETNRGDTTIESPGDVDVFIIHAYEINPGIWREALGYVETPTHKSAINTWLSPKRAMLEWRGYIEGTIYGILNVLPYPVKLTVVLPDGDADNNITVHSDYDGSDAIESSDELLGGVGMMFKPYIFKIKTSGTVDLADILESNHNGYISFVYRGVTLKGHIMEVSANPTRRKVLEFTLLAHKDTDLYELHPNYTPPS